MILIDYMADEGTPLSPLEGKILELAAEGLSNQQIGDRLNFSPKTVESYLYNAYGKLGVLGHGQGSRVAAVAGALRRGWIGSDKEHHRDVYREGFLAALDQIAVAIEAVRQGMVSP